MTVLDLAEHLDRDPRTARFAMVASGAMGVVRTRFLPSPKRLIAETGFQQRHAFSVRNETVARIKDYPFMKSFRIMGAGYVEKALRRDYGLSGTTVNHGELTGEGGGRKLVGVDYRTKNDNVR